jgi:hypothetical protein
MSKKIETILAIKKNDGTNILGYYLEDDITKVGEEFVVLYQPITVSSVTYSTNNTNIRTYMGNPYFMYGETGIVTIPLKDVVHRDIASDFFKLYYVRTLDEILALEKATQDSYMEFYIKADIKNIMKNTDSIFVDISNEYKQ